MTQTTPLWPALEVGAVAGIRGPQASSGGVVGGRLHGVMGWQRRAESADRILIHATHSAPRPQLSQQPTLAGPTARARPPLQLCIALWACSGVSARRSVWTRLESHS